MSMTLFFVSGFQGMSTYGHTLTQKLKLKMKIKAKAKARTKIKTARGI